MVVNISYDTGKEAYRKLRYSFFQTMHTPVEIYSIITQCTHNSVAQKRDQVESEKRVNYTQYIKKLRNRPYEYIHAIRELNINISMQNSAEKTLKTRLMEEGGGSLNPTVQL